MKFSSLAFSLLLASAAAMSTTVRANDPLDGPVPVLISAKHIYTPLGFDSNDNTEIVVSGYLRNLCYKAPTATATVKDNVISVELKALLTSTPNTLCAQMAVPFIEAVSIGVLKKGDYKISVNGASEGAGVAQISVAQAASANIDDNIYANVSSVEVSGRKGVLRGYTPSDCMVLDTIKFISNKSDTYSVLPIMKQVRSLCPMKLVPFAYEFEVPTALTAKSVLLHVRAMNGKSVNTIFDNGA